MPLFLFSCRYSNGYKKRHKYLFLLIAAAIVEISESHIASHDQGAVHLKLRNVLLTDHNLKPVHDARGALSLSRFFSSEQRGPANSVTVNSGGQRTVSQ